MNSPPDDLPPDPLAEALILLGAAVDGCDEQVGRLGEQTTEQAVALLRRLRAERQRLAAVEAAVEAMAARLLGKRGDHEVAGHVVRVNQYSKTTWLDPRALAWRIAEPLILDRGSGEMRADPDLVAEILDRLFDMLRVDYFRVGTMTDHGVQFDDLVKREPGRRTVQFVSPGGES